MCACIQTLCFEAPTITTISASLLNSKGYNQERGIMKTKDLSTQVRDQDVEKNRSGLGSRKYSTTLNIPKSSNKSIIRKRKGDAITAKLPTEGCPSKLMDQVRRTLTREAFRR